MCLATSWRLDEYPSLPLCSIHWHLFILTWPCADKQEAASTQLTNLFSKEKILLLCAFLMCCNIFLSLCFSQLFHSVAKPSSFFWKYVCLVQQQTCWYLRIYTSIYPTWILLKGTTDPLKKWKSISRGFPFIKRGNISEFIISLELEQM